MANDDQKGEFSPGAYSLHKEHFKIVHISNNHDIHSPTDDYLKQALNKTNQKYTLETLKDRTNIPADIFKDCQTILLSFWSGVDVKKCGDLVADAVDKGVNVVIVLFANSSSYQHPTGRFMEQNYNAITRADCPYIQGTLGKVHIPYHPIMTNVNAMSVGSETRRAKGVIPNGEQQNVDRVADWNNGDVMIAIRHNKPGLITEITCSHGANGTKSDGQQLINNALRLKRDTAGPIRPIKLMKVIEESNFHILQKIQQQFSKEQMFSLQNDGNFQGFNAVYEDISKQFAKILDASFNTVSSQINNGMQQKIDALNVSKAQCLKEIESMKERFKKMGLPDNVIAQTEAPMVRHVKTLQTDIDTWEKLKKDTAELVSSKK